MTMTMTNKKRDAKDYAVEKTVETLKIIEALDYEPVSIERVIERVGYIPILNRKIKFDAARRILITLKMLGYADQIATEWIAGKKSIKF